MDRITVVLADEQHLVRTGLKQVLGQAGNVQIVGEAGDEEELLELIETKHPRIVIMDYNQPDSFQHETVIAIKRSSPNTNVLIISADNEKQSIYRVLENGVSSFITKTCGEEEIIDAVNATAKGEKFFCTKVVDYLLEKSFSKEEENCAPTPLTNREIEIVRLIAKGLIAKEIAGELHLSVHTVYTHRKKIMKKLALSSSSELVLYAVNQGILES
jgi:DNA-binding NarL/FixJ family response regulator